MGAQYAPGLLVLDRSRLGPFGQGRLKDSSLGSKCGESLALLTLGPVGFLVPGFQGVKCPSVRTLDLGLQQNAASKDVIVQ